jgi:transposase-like protein
MLHDNKPESCPKCGESHIVKSGKHYCQKGIVQRYECKTCGTTFSNDGYFRGKHPLSLLQYANAIYENGLSLRQVQAKIKKTFGIQVTHVAIQKWLRVLGSQARPLNSGDQKNKIIREIVQIGILTTVRMSNSLNPEKFMVLQNAVSNLNDMKAVLSE